MSLPIQNFATIFQTLMLCLILSLVVCIWTIIGNYWEPTRAEEDACVCMQWLRSTSCCFDMLRTEPEGTATSTWYARLKHIIPTSMVPGDTIDATCVRVVAFELEWSRPVILVQWTQTWKKQLGKQCFRKRGKAEVTLWTRKHINKKHSKPKLQSNEAYIGHFTATFCLA